MRYSKQFQNTHKNIAPHPSLNLHRLLFKMLLLVALLSSFVLQPSAAKSLDVSYPSASLTEEGGDGGASHHLHQQQQQHHLHRRRRLQRDSTSNADHKDLSVREQCDSVKGYFSSIDIQLDGIYEQKGSLCGGHCCSNSTEVRLKDKATSEFERLLHHHTKSLRGILESTASLFQNHVLELTEQSENKTLNVFSQVYRRMAPLSRKLIHQLYTEIISHLKNFNNNNLSNLDDAIHKFFVNLFPVAYHQAVHLNKDNYGELHEDYINCLKHTFDDLQPFGTLPKEITQNLLQSVQTATIFMNSLVQSAEVLSETDELYAIYLTETCKKQLLKMSYCPSCNGLQKTQVKPCYSYCMNVLRGCSAQYAGILDSPWSNVVDALDNLAASHVRIVTTIKQLDGKLSETIMRAMENGPELEKKVKKTCGIPKLILTTTTDSEVRPMSQHNIKWATPPDAEILHFLSTIDKSKEFYSNIVNNVCEDEDIQRNDHHCWTGDRVGDYTQLVMTTGVDTQRYNPEVPFEVNSQSTKLNELVDKLIKIRKNIGGAVPSNVRTYSDIQSDMARHDEEGSGRIMPDDVDDEEFSMSHASGDGSGEGGATPSPYDPPTQTEGIEPKTGSATINQPLLSITITLVATILVNIFSTSSRSYLYPTH